MYYSRNSPQRQGERIVIPVNYSGNTFKVKDETDRREPRPPYTEPDTDATDDVESEALLTEEVSVSESTENQKPKEDEKSSSLSENLPKSNAESTLSSLLRDINIEDLLLFSLVFLMYRDDPDDDILLLLILLIFLK